MGYSVVHVVALVVCSTSQLWIFFYLFMFLIRNNQQDDKKNRTNCIRN